MLGEKTGTLSRSRGGSSVLGCAARGNPLLPQPRTCPALLSDGRAAFGLLLSVEGIFHSGVGIWEEDGLNSEAILALSTGK